MITQSELKELFNYNPETGIFTRIKRTANRNFVGEIAGSKHHSGYIVITINGKRHQMHRLAWIYHYGEQPSNFIDHINGIRDDNRIENLRCATNAENLQNLKTCRKDNKSGLLGVCVRKNGTFVSFIRLNGKGKHLGVFKTKELAHAAYLDEKRKMHQYCTI